MAKVVSTTEAKNKLTSLMAWAGEHQDAIIVKFHGKPRAVILSFVEYEKLKALADSSAGAIYSTGCDGLKSGRASVTRT